MQALDWPTLREMFVEMYARLNVQPILAANERRLKSGETVQTYIDEKSRLLKLAKQPQASIVSLLTDGMPDAYRSAIIGANPQTISDWLDVAQRFEVSRKRDYVKPFSWQKEKSAAWEEGEDEPV